MELPEEATKMIDALLEEHLRNWIGSAEEYATEHHSDLLPSVPSALQREMSFSVEEIESRLQEALDTTRVRPSQWRQQELLVKERIHGLKDNCHLAWADMVLRRRKDIKDRLQGITAAVISLTRPDEDGLISERAVMTNLYVLDLEMKTSGIEGAGDDWKQIIKAIESDTSFFSPAYLICIHQLALDGRTSPVKEPVGANRYIPTDGLGCWAVERLERLQGKTWLESFVTLCRAVCDNTPPPEAMAEKALAEFLGTRH